MRIINWLFSKLFPVRFPELTHEDLLAVRLLLGEIPVIEHESCAGVVRRIERQTGIERMAQEETMHEVVKRLRAGA